MNLIGDARGGALLRLRGWCTFLARQHLPRAAFKSSEAQAMIQLHREVMALRVTLDAALFLLWEKEIINSGQLREEIEAHASMIQGELEAERPDIARLVETVTADRLRKLRRNRVSAGAGR